MNAEPESHGATKRERELCDALRDAIRCVQYCRRNHPDPQKDEGVPVEALWLELIARIEGHDFTDADFIKACIESRAHGDSR